MSLFEKIAEKTVVCVIEWDRKIIKDLKQLKKHAGGITLKQRIGFGFRHNERYGMLYTVIWSRTPMPEAMKISIRAGIVSQMPTQPEINGVHTVSEWFKITKKVKTSLKSI